MLLLGRVVLLLGTLALHSVCVDALNVDVPAAAAGHGWCSGGEYVPRAKRALLLRRKRAQRRRLHRLADPPMQLLSLSLRSP